MHEFIKNHNYRHYNLHELIRNNILLLLFCLIISPGALAQTKIDSLKRQLSQARDDTNKVKTIIEICWNYQWEYPDSALAYTLPALSLARRLHFTSGEITILLIMGETLAIKGDYYEALKIELQALQLCENLKLSHKVADCNLWIGNIYFYSGSYQKALDYYYKAKSFYGIVINEYDEEGISGLIGETYFKLNQMDSALIYLQKAYVLDIISTHNNWSIPYYFLGHIHAEKKQFALAMDYYRIGLSVSVFDKDVLDGLVSMATLFRNTGMADSAVYLSKIVIKKGVQKSFLTHVIDASILLKDMYKLNNETDSAFKYQEIMLAAKDSLLSRAKLNQFQSLSFTEQFRQLELEEQRRKEKDDRNHNIQYLAIAIGLISFTVLFLFLSQSIIVNEKWVSFLGILGLLIVFEFINLLIHPFLEKITNYSPVFMLIILVAIAAFLIPVHHRLETWVKSKMVERNKRIRLVIAKKIVERLDGSPANLQDKMQTG
jgi:tetratricopeptide (TPR) repeat protein